MTPIERLICRASIEYQRTGLVSTDLAAKLLDAGVDLSAVRL